MQKYCTYYIPFINIMLYKSHSIIRSVCFIYCYTKVHFVVVVKCKVQIYIHRHNYYEIIKSNTYIDLNIYV